MEIQLFALKWYNLYNSGTRWATIVKIEVDLLLIIRYITYWNLKCILWTVFGNYIQWKPIKVPLFTLKGHSSGTKSNLIFILSLETPYLYQNLKLICWTVIELSHGNQSLNGQWLPYDIRRIFARALITIKRGDGQLKREVGEKGVGGGRRMGGRWNEGTGGGRLRGRKISILNRKGGKFRKKVGGGRWERVTLLSTSS
jgi:hypothetical protein